jgi:L-asparaginase II
LHPAALVRVIRSGLEESVHLGHVAVCDAEGNLLAWAGNPHQQVFARSSMKPLQAAVSLQAIGRGEDLQDAEVAVMCASHNAEPVHLEAVARILGRAGLHTSDLRCPPGWPLDLEAIASSGGPRRELHNCSGKHAGMLLACVRRDWDVGGYRDPGHPLQRRVFAAVLAGAGLARVEMGVDGCGIPVHGLPVSRMATLYARLSRPEWLHDLRPWAERAVSAMMAQPYLVAGRNRDDTALMTEADGIAAKAGAEGLLCAAILDSGLGVAVKVHDGGWRAAGPALIHALALLEVLDQPTLERLHGFARPRVLGGGDPVGEVVADFELDRA